MYHLEWILIIPDQHHGWSHMKELCIRASLRFFPFFRFIWFIIHFCRNYYSPGSGTLYFDKRSLGVKPMEVVFDSGSTYTYFTAQPYQAVVSAVNFVHDAFWFPWIFEETNTELLILWPCSSKVVSANHLNRCQIPVCPCAGKGRKHSNLCLTSRRNSSHCFWALPVPRMPSWRSPLKTTSLSL